MTIQRWYYLFDRDNRWEIIADSICYCQANKGLELNGYVFILNHLHIIATAPNMTGFVRDFKKLFSGSSLCVFKLTRGNPDGKRETLCSRR